jgi:catechol 2,3-dioxygenase-like lactoylglutathione lyase family enzyme
MLALADVAVPVSNAQKSAEWWERTLGFSTHRIGGPTSHAIQVAPPGDRFILHLCEGFAPVEPGNSGIAFVSDDAEGLVRSMEAKGVRFAQPFQKTDWGGSAKFEDPDGNVFWLLAAPTEFIRGEVDRRAGQLPDPPA